MEANIEVHPLEVRGQSFKVSVSSAGEWWSEFGGRIVRSDTRDGLYKALMRRTKEAEVKLDIPFDMRTDNDRIRRGTVTGLHAGNGNLLIHWENGQSTQESRPGTTSRPLTADERATWRRLITESAAARMALSEFERANRLDLLAAAKAAVAQTVAASNQSS